MNTFYQKCSVLFIGLLGLIAFPLHAQQVDQNETEQPFIRQGDLLSGFSLGFTNASADYSDPQFGNEYTNLRINLEGLYFVSDHIGIGPVLGYRFSFRDLDPAWFGYGDVRDKQFLFGIKGGWYTSANELFNTNSLGRAQFFVDAGVNWLRSSSQVGTVESEPDYLPGYEIGTGFLFPVGDQIAIETRLGFQSRLEEPIISGGERAWLSDISLNVGFKVQL